MVDIALYCIVLKFHCSRLPGTWLKVCGGWWWVSQTNYRVTPTWLLQDRSNKLQVILRFEAQLERMTVTPATSYCYCWFADLQDSSYKLHMNLRSKVPLARMSVTPAITYIGFLCRPCVVRSAPGS